MKNIARSYLWWPGLDTEIEDKVKSCKVCQFHRAAPLHPWEGPEKSWSRIHIDHAGPFMGQLFSYFEKKKLICQWCERMYLCAFICWDVCCRGH